jgi:hypothetical protein
MDLLYSLPPVERSAGRGGGGEDGVADDKAGGLLCYDDLITV